MKKIILIIITIILILGITGCGETKTTKIFDNTSGSLINKSGLRGTYLSSTEATDKISIAVDVMGGAMKSPLSPPPQIKIVITNHTDKPIVLTKGGESGKFAILIFSLDKNRIPLNSFFLPPTTIRPKESWSWEGLLFASVETRGFDVRILYYK